MGQLMSTGNFTLIGALGALVVIFLNHLLASTRDARKRRVDEGQKIVEAFSPELDALIKSNNDCRHFLTDIAFNRHESAVRNFMPFLSWLDRLRMKYAWLILVYHKNDKQSNIPFYEQYADFGSLDKRRKIRPILIKRMQKIVSFANK